MNKIGMTIEEAAEYTSIGRDTLRRMVEWGKIPVLRIGRKSIVRTDTIERFMEINQGVDLLDREQIRSVTIRF
ncbi:excisionase [Flavonifractor plautii]|uniref:excisionase n=1 Tax=Flavonifractor plautii TaxID=292800 RepID=UPI00210BDC7A|nr:excisionase [Flavonifractor plautii]MCQ5309010.1 excisionase family DNA-binding protein [Flavonifractor plautii]